MFRYKYSMSIVINFVPGVDMILLKRILNVRRSTVGVPQSPG